jgi:Family of unknown function (DUF6498)
MNGASNPVVIAQAVARNVVPLVGILVFHWSTGNVLILYLLDTLLSMAVIIAGLASSFASPPNDEGVGGWINAEAGYVLAGLLVAAFLAVPLGMPVGIMLAASGFSFREAFNDTSLRGGALVQTVVALWSYIELYRALRTHSPAQLKLRQRFALVFMRWVVVIMATYFILDILPPSEFVLLILVVAYIAGSIVAEVAPDRFLRAMPGGEENLEPDASTTARPTNPRTFRNRARRGKR